MVNGSDTVSHHVQRDKLKKSMLCCDSFIVSLCNFFSSLQADLVSTIGESAAMGTAGVVIWERSETKTEVQSYTFA